MRKKSVILSDFSQKNRIEGWMLKSRNQMIRNPEKDGIEDLSNLGK